METDKEAKFPMETHCKCCLLTKNLHYELHTTPRRRMSQTMVSLPSPHCECNYARCLRRTFLAGGLKRKTFEKLFSVCKSLSTLAYFSPFIQQ